MAASRGTGSNSSVTFGGSSFAANLLELGDIGATRPKVDTTAMGTGGAMTGIPGDYYDPGEFTMRVQHYGWINPPVTSTGSGGQGGAEDITIYLGSTSYPATTSGFMSSYSAGATINELMEADITVALTGAISWSTSS